MDLFAAANRFNVDSLLLQCGTFLSENIVDGKYACSLLEMAHMYNEEHLFSKCFSFIEQYTSAVLGDQAFLNLPEELVICILQSDELQMDEVEVFQAVLRWGRHQVQLRSLKKQNS